MLYCILAYPVLVHLSIVLGQPALAGVALVALFASFVYKPLAARRPWAWLALLLAAVASAAIVAAGATLYALYLPPVVLPLSLLAWWAPTLRAGQTPVVTRIATLVRGPLSPEYAAYTRSVTQLWVGVFALMAGSSAALAVLAPPEIWSLFTNFLNVAFLGCVFLAEYLYRLWRFRHMPHPDFLTFIRQVAKAGARPGGA